MAIAQPPQPVEGGPTQSDSIQFSSSNDGPGLAHLIIMVLAQRSSLRILTNQFGFLHISLASRDNGVSRICAPSTMIIDRRMAEAGT